MTEPWLQGSYVELTYALRVFAKCSTMSANLETINGDVIDIARTHNGIIHKNFKSLRRSKPSKKAQANTLQKEC